MAYKKTLFFLFVFISLSFLAQGQITSTFNSDIGGWIGSDINLSDVRPVTHNSTGGNPGVHQPPSDRLDISINPFSKRNHSFQNNKEILC